MTSVRALIKYSPYTIEVTNYLIKRLDIWRRATDAIGRFKVNLVGDWIGQFDADDPIQIQISDIVVLEGIINKGIPFAEGQVYQQYYSLVGRDYGQDLLNKQVNKSGAWSYAKQYADDIIYDMLDKANSEISFGVSGDHKYVTDDVIGTIAYTDVGDETLIEAFRKIFEQIDYDFYVDDDLILHIFPIGSIDSGITLSNIANSADNNLLDLKKIEFDTYDLRNYIVAKVDKIDDGWSDGNAEDFVGMEGNTITDDTSDKEKGISSIKNVKGEEDDIKTSLEFPLYNYDHLPFDIVKEDTLRFEWKITASEDLEYGVDVILEDTNGKKIVYRNRCKDRNLWHQFTVPMGTAVHITKYENCGVLGTTWHKIMTDEWQCYTDYDSSLFNWKIVKITWLMSYEKMSNVIFVTDMRIDNLTIPFGMLAIAQDETSQEDYGVRDYTIQARNIRTQSELQSLADYTLLKLKDPLYSLNVTALGSAGTITHHVWNTPSAIHSKCGETGSYLAVNTIDNNVSTFWNHGATCEHWIIFDLGASRNITKIRIFQSTTAAQRFGKDVGFYVYVSDDPVHWGDAVWEGILDASGWQETGAFDKDGRYIKLVSKSDAEAQRVYEFDAYAELTQNRWVPGYMVTVNSPEDSIDNEEYRISEAHIIIIDQLKEGHDYIVESTLVPKALTISGRRLSGVLSPEVALLREISDRVRYFEKAEVLYYDYLPPLPADAASKIRVGDFGNLAETNVAWTRHFEAEDSAYDEEWVEVEDAMASKGKALKMAGAGVSKDIFFIDGPLGAVGEFYFLIRIKVSDRTKEGTIIIQIYDKDGPSILGTVSLSPSNCPVNNKYHHFALRCEIPADKQNIHFKLMSTKGDDYDLYCDYGALVPADLPLGYADVTLSEHLGTDTSSHAGADADAHSGADADSHADADTDSHGGSEAAVRGAGVLSSAGSSGTKSRVTLSGTTGVFVDAITIPNLNSDVELLVVNVVLSYVSADVKVKVRVQVNPSQPAYYPHVSTTPVALLDSTITSNSFVITVPKNINGLTVKIQVAPYDDGSQNDEVDVNYASFGHSQHTHTMTNPDDHSVTQPSDHTVTQPGNHVVTNPEDHSITQPEAHSTEGEGHEH